MAKRNKLQKFSEMAKFPNVYQNFDFLKPQLVGAGERKVDLKNKWISDHFKNDNPLVLELACGRGEYSLALARSHPEKNFVGVDVKGARIWKGAHIALDEKLDNVAFVRTKIELLDRFFGLQEIDEIWITFPDPFLAKANRRLTAPSFLNLYRKLLKPEAIIHLKTDDPVLYEFTYDTLQKEQAEILYHHENIYSEALAFPELEYKTYYEYQHLADGRTIKYIKFKLL
jgi:tRNA (guanine-N7-)-methyltransferase